MSHPLVHYSIACNGQDGARGQAEARNPVQVSHMGGEDPAATCAITTPARICISRRLESRARAGGGTLALSYVTQVS